MSDSNAVAMQIPVLWGDCDALGHVNNARYFTWFESARIRLFERVGLVVAGEAATLGPVLATTTCDFERPVHYPGTIEARARVTKVGESSIALAYEIVGAEDGALYASGTSVAVLVDYRTMQKTRVPDEMRAKLHALSSSEA